MIYKKNFLTKVVFRIDFDQIKLGKLKQFSEKIESIFPLFEEGKGIEGEVNLDLKTKEIKQSSNQFSTWIFSNREKTKKMIIHPTFLSLEYDKYSNSSELISDIEYVSIFISNFDINTLNRAGLRYINEISIDEQNPLRWGNYFDESLLGSLKFILDKERVLARGMTQLIIKEDFGNLNFNYGIWNKDFPNEIVDKSFILDFDAYSKFPLSTENTNLVEIVKNYNQKIEKLFEDVIKDEFRNLLNS